MIFFFISIITNYKTNDSMYNCVCIRANYRMKWNLIKRTLRGFFPLSLPIPFPLPVISLFSFFCFDNQRLWCNNDTTSTTTTTTTCMKIRTHCSPMQMELCCTYRDIDRDRVTVYLHAIRTQWSIDQFPFIKYALRAWKTIRCINYQRITRYDPFSIQL